MTLSAESSYLFIRRIAEEEDLNGFMNQISVARAIPDATITKSLCGKKLDTTPLWFVPQNVSATVDAFWMSLPSLQETLDNHTRTPLDFAFRHEEDTRKLIKARLEPGRLFRGNSNLRGRLKVCAECIEQDHRTYGYAYWHRLALMPGVDVCSRHASVLLTLCGGCEAKNLATQQVPWQPSHRCHCNGRLRVVQKFSEAHMKAELAIAKMAQQLLSKEHDPRTTSDVLSQRLRNYCAQNALDENAPDSIFNEILHDKLGAEYLAKIRLGLESQRRLIRYSGKGAPLVEPLVNLSAVYAVFGGWEGYEETTKTLQDKSQGYEPTLNVVSTLVKHGEPVKTRAQEYMKGYMKNLSMTAYKRHFLEFSEEQFSAFREEARQWLQKILQEAPCITRKGLRESKKTNRFFAFLNLFDKEYYDIAMPGGKKISEPDIETRLKDIFARRELILKELPGIRITAGVLLENRRKKGSLGRRDERIKSAFDSCKDTTESYQERLVPILCQMVRSIQSSSRYGDEEYYRSSEGKLCGKRIQEARTWVRRASQSVTAHSYLFQGRRRRG